MPAAAPVPDDAAGLRTLGRVEAEFAAEVAEAFRVHGAPALQQVPQGGEASRGKVRARAQDRGRLGGQLHQPAREQVGDGLRDLGLASLRPSLPVCSRTALR
jgi:hypothetical protein